MSTPSPRAEPRAAAPELIVLQIAEDFAAWLLPRSMRWPKHARLSLTSRIESLCLDVVDELVQARYQTSGRLARLDGVNLMLERLRHLFRLAAAAGACTRAHHEGAVRRVDEIGRTLHGWRASLRSRDFEQ